MERDIETLIRSFTLDLQRLTRSAVVESVASALGSNGAPARRAAAPALGAPRASAKGDHTVRVLEQVRATPGIRVEQLAEKLARPSAELKPVVAKLVASGDLRKQGQRRGTRYYAR
ncbi:hypothetical protein [Sandaracinus amylolyticus]|uniref:hypothetical protein n=1 Tax=Sandaracinus amylolyticus TaxID=927083 RepID=UPI001F215AC5|nr:hypothetical protein [Sandaracinus amylolyticus]UJR82891.1 Hypothetical protein I5071_49560 [Sandaracinus amylolyticus]